MSDFITDDDAGEALPRHTVAGVTYRNGKMFVTRKVKGAAEEAENVEIEVQPFASAPAYVNVRYGLTVNMGDFESARIEVGVSMPCYPEEIDRVFTQASTWVGERIEQERQEIEEEVRRRKGKEE